MSETNTLREDRLIDVGEILMGLFNGETKEINFEEFQKQAMDEIKLKIKQGSLNEAGAQIAKSFESSDYLGLRQLADSDLPVKLAGVVPVLAKGVQDYVKGKAGKGEFVNLIGSSCKDLGVELLKPYGIDAKALSENYNAIMELSPSAVAVICFSEVYKITMSALNDAELAYERRVRIEEACNASIANIRQYREQIEDIVSKYLTEKLDKFGSGFKAMDEAIMNNDTDGFIKGNAVIQEALGYKPRFTNQEEFDDLMLSDEAFKF